MNFQISNPLKHIQMPQLLNFICTLITLFILNATVTGQEQTLNDENISPIIGKWEGNFLHKGHGPIYYRGYFKGELATEEQIDELLKHFKITNIVVGHTTHRQIETRYSGKVIVIDANMKSGNAGEILFWDSGEFVRGTLTGEQLELDKM